MHAQLVSPEITVGIAPIIVLQLTHCPEGEIKDPSDGLQIHWVPFQI
jgi:hypothetical protein